jgi:hypothetical protein
MDSDEHDVNEFRFGKTGGATQFSPDLTSDMFAGTGFGGMNGYAIAWSGFKHRESLSGLRQQRSRRQDDGVRG